MEETKACGRVDDFSSLRWDMVGNFYHEISTHFEQGLSPGLLTFLPPASLERP